MLLIIVPNICPSFSLGSTPLDKLVKENGPSPVLVVIREGGLDLTTKFQDIEPLVLVDASVLGFVEEEVELGEERPLAAEEEGEEGARSLQVDRSLVLLPREVEGKPVNALKRVGVGEAGAQRIEFINEFLRLIALERRHSLEPLGEGEEAHVLRLQVPRDRQHHHVLRLNANVLAKLLHSQGTDYLSVLVGILVEPGDAGFTGKR